jgi:hypothetical protein
MLSLYNSTLFFSENAALLLTKYHNGNGKKAKYVCSEKNGNCNSSYN